MDGGKLAKEEVDQKKEDVEKKEETKPEQVWFQPRSQGLVPTSFPGFGSNLVPRVWFQPRSQGLVPTSFPGFGSTLTNDWL